MRILIVSTLLLTGCASNCFERAVIAKESITTARESAAILAGEKKISKGQAQEIQTSLDIAKVTAENGAALCFQNESDALDEIEAANKSLSDAIKIVRENNE